MLTRLILFFQLLVQPSISFLFGAAGGNGLPCGCSCSSPPQTVCAPQPVCAQPAPCAPQPACAPVALCSQPPVDQPSWIPPTYSTSYSSISSAPMAFYSIVPPPTSPPLPPLLPTADTMAPDTYYEKFQSVTPSYLQSGYAPASKNYEKQYQQDNSLEEMDPSQNTLIPPPPPPPPIDMSSRVFPIDPQTYDYRTSETVQQSIQPAYSNDLEEDRLIEKQGYWPKSSSEISMGYNQFKNRHKVLKRMKNSKEEANIPRTNNTCNSIKLANVMMRAIMEDVTISKRMIQRETGTAFDGAKFDVFCASGEFSYSIHSRKYCEITKDDVTCFAFR